MRREYKAIGEVLKTAGLHCCKDPKKAEDEIKSGLKVAPKKKTK